MRSISRRVIYSDCCPEKLELSSVRENKIKLIIGVFCVSDIRGPIAGVGHGIESPIGVRTPG